MDRESFGICCWSEVVGIMWIRFMSEIESIKLFLRRQSYLVPIVIMLQVRVCRCHMELDL